MSNKPVSVTFMTAGPLLCICILCFMLSFLYKGKTKCMMKTGDCVIKHPGVFVTGTSMVVSGTLHEVSNE